MYIIIKVNPTEDILQSQGDFFLETGGYRGRGVYRCEGGGIVAGGIGFWDVGSIHGDEYYTRREDAEIIADNLLRIPLKVWLPFNDTESVWVDVLKERGFEVIATESDFFTTDPPEGVQCIISNPPFSKKRDVMDRIKALNLRFVLILPFQWLNDGIPLEYGHQLIFFRQRMYFNTPQGCLNKPRANCFVLSDGLLKSNLTLIDKRRGDT